MKEIEEGGQFPPGSHYFAIISKTLFLHARLITSLLYLHVRISAAAL